MPEKCVIFLPDTLNLTSESRGHFQGVHHKFNDCEAYYITRDQLVLDENNGNIIGSCNVQVKTNCIGTKPRRLVYNTRNGEFLRNGQDSFPHILVIYDYKQFRYNQFGNTPVGRNPLEHPLEMLINSVNTHNNKINEDHTHWTSFLIIHYLLQCILKVLATLQPLTRFSATISHFHENLYHLRWCLMGIDRNQLSPMNISNTKAPILNYAVAKLVDVVIGCLLLHALLRHETPIMHGIRSAHTATMQALQELFTYLMGAPIGLKLNGAFNMCLGKFFFYHVAQWRLFLQQMYAALFEPYFRYLVLPAALGVSYQVAMVSDLMAIASIHVYCIYVYAARLLNLQLRGLLSIWYLLIGRKYNPLRDRIDSCHYTNDQLLIGTLAFTILLFLLPTTLVYYVVFATLAVFFWILETVLQRLTILLSWLPLYGIVRWLLKPTIIGSSLSGKFHMKWLRMHTNGTVVVALKVPPMNLRRYLQEISPPSFCSACPTVFTRRIILYSVFMGYPKGTK